MTTSEYRTPVWSIGERMAKARHDAGLSQQEMANQLTTAEKPVSKQTISNWENDVNQPRRFRERLDQWSDITGVAVSWLLGLPVPDYPESSATRVSLNAAGHLPVLALA